MERSLPKHHPGFTLVTGIPNTASKSYFASSAEAWRRCVGDPKCVGMSAQRLFYGDCTSIIPGRPGEVSLVRTAATTTVTATATATATATSTSGGTA